MKTIYGDGWVKVTPWRNRRFFTEGHCERCHGFSCAPGWLNIYTKAYRCAKCFDPRRDAA